MSQRHLLITASFFFFLFRTRALTQRTRNIYYKINQTNMLCAINKKKAAICMCCWRRRRRRWWCGGGTAASLRKEHALFEKQILFVLIDFCFSSNSIIRFIVLIVVGADLITEQAAGHKIETHFTLRKTSNRDALTLKTDVKWTEKEQMRQSCSSSRERTAATAQN